MSASVAELERVIAEERTSRMSMLYTRHAADAGRLAYLLTGDRVLAEDLAQEAFVRLIGRLDFIRDDAAVRSYLRRSVVNLARKHWRRHALERDRLRRDGSATRPHAASSPDLATRDELWEALSKLTYRQRSAVVLRFYEDLSEEQTARALGCRVGTVKSAVARGLLRLREELEDAGA